MVFLDQFRLLSMYYANVLWPNVGRTEIRLLQNPAVGLISAVLNRFKNIQTAKHSHNIRQQCSELRWTLFKSFKLRTFKCKRNLSTKAKWFIAINQQLLGVDRHFGIGSPNLELNSKTLLQRFWKELLTDSYDHNREAFLLRQQKV